MQSAPIPTRVRTFGRVTAATLTLCSGLAAFGQMSATPDRLITRGVLEWKTGAVAVPAQGAVAAAQMAGQLAAASDRHVLVQFNASVLPAERAELEAAGVKLQGYVGDNAFYAHLPAAVDTAKLSAIANLRAVQPIAIEWKLDRTYLNAKLWDYAVARPEEEAAEDEAPPAPAGQR